MSVAENPVRSINLDVIKSYGYAHVRQLEDGTVIGVAPQMYTYGLFVGLTEKVWEKRYCYEFAEDAINAAKTWDGLGDPPGPWIKVKPGDRLGPGAFLP
jgi:hypothetical protein